MDDYVKIEKIGEGNLNIINYLYSLHFIYIYLYNIVTNSYLFYIILFYIKFVTITVVINN